MTVSRGLLFTVTLVVASTLVGCELATSGFNDVSGLNGDETADNLPFNTSGVSLDGQGVGEPGWAGPWRIEDGGADVVSNVTFEGDGAAAFFGGTTIASRTLATAPTDCFQVDAHVMIPAAITRDVLFRVYDSSIEEVNDSIAVQWAVMSDKSFQTLDGAGDSTGVWEETGFTLTPGVWHKVTTVVDPSSQTWTFAVDDQQYDAPDPLGFRGNPVSLDAVQYVNEISGPDGSYLDHLVISEPFCRRRLSRLGRMSQSSLLDLIWGE